MAYPSSRSWVAGACGPHSVRVTPQGRSTPNILPKVGPAKSRPANTRCVWNPFVENRDPDQLRNRPFFGMGQFPPCPDSARKFLYRDTTGRGRTKGRFGRGVTGKSRAPRDGIGVFHRRRGRRGGSCFCNTAPIPARWRMIDTWGPS